MRTLLKFKRFTLTIFAISLVIFYEWPINKYDNLKADKHADRKHYNEKCETKNPIHIHLGETGGYMTATDFKINSMALL